MNNRIRELAEQAEDWADSQNFYASDYRDYLMEKFAQLIVKECMDVLDPGEHQLIARFQARQWLAEHFGIASQPLSNVDRILQTVRTRGQ
jgi:hypothetical protein